MLGGVLGADIDGEDAESGHFGPLMVDEFESELFDQASIECAAFADGEVKLFGDGVDDLFLSAGLAHRSDFCCLVECPGMSWKDKEAEVLARLEVRLSKKNWDWLQGAVTWRAGDLYEATTTEVRTWFDRPRPDNTNGINDTALIRSLIWQNWIKIQAGTVEPINGNLRTFWYKIVEPFFREHSLISVSLTRGGDTVEKTLYQNVLDFLGDFVRNRVFLYSQEFQFEAPPDGRYIIGRDRPKYIFFTEKDGLWKTLCLPMAQGGEEGLEIQISVIATRGQPPFITVEYLARELQSLTDPVAHPVILVFCDYDPWGLRIAEQIDAKMRFFGFKSVTTYRLVTLDLFTPRNIKGAKDLSNMTNSMADIDHWMEETGGVNGEKKGIHCDVISSGRRDELLKKVRQGIRTNTLAEKFPLVKPVHLDHLGEEGEPVGRLYV